MQVSHSPRHAALPMAICEYPCKDSLFFPQRFAYLHDPLTMQKVRAAQRKNAGKTQEVPKREDPFKTKLLIFSQVDKLVLSFCTLSL